MEEIHSANTDSLASLYRCEKDKQSHLPRWVFYILLGYHRLLHFAT